MLIPKLLYVNYNIDWSIGFKNPINCVISVTLLNIYTATVLCVFYFGTFFNNHDFFHQIIPANRFLSIYWDDVMNSCWKPKILFTMLRQLVSTPYVKKNWKKTEEPRMVRKYKVKNNDYINISKNITKKIIFILHSSFAKKNCCQSNFVIRWWQNCLSDESHLII